MPYPPTKEVLFEGAFAATVFGVVYDGSSFAGFNAASDHGQNTATAATSSVLIPCDASSQIVLVGVNAFTAHTGAGTASGFHFRVSPSGDSGDWLDYTATPDDSIFSDVELVGPVGTPIVFYFISGNEGTALNTWNIFQADYYTVPQGLPATATT